MQVRFRVSRFCSWCVATSATSSFRSTSRRSSSSSSRGSRSQHSGTPPHLTTSPISTSLLLSTGGADRLDRFDSIVNHPLVGFVLDQRRRVTGARLARPAHRAAASTMTTTSERSEWPQTVTTPSDHWPQPACSPCSRRPPWAAAPGPLCRSPWSLAPWSSLPRVSYIKAIDVWMIVSLSVHSCNLLTYLISFSLQSADWPERTSSKWPILCWVRRKNLNSITITLFRLIKMLWHLSLQSDPRRRLSVRVSTAVTYLLGFVRLIPASL